VGAGLRIGYEHTFGNQAADLMNAIAQNKPMQPNFDDGLKCQLVLDAVMEASSCDRWVRVKQMTKSEAI
jgi:predicted dehydrogenase